MKAVKKKAMHFLTALLDAYRDEEKRELDALQKLELSGDITEDITAMLLAIMAFVDRASDYDGDIIDFTHMLNKLAVQYVMDGKEDRQ